METQLTIIADGLVVTCDPEGRGGRCSILVRDGRIGDISESTAMLHSLYPDANVIDASRKIILPGFVNAHYHTESALLGLLTGGKHYGTWKQDLQLREIAAALADPAAGDDLRVLYQAAGFAHLKYGTTCVGDFPPGVEGRGLSFVHQGVERTALRSVVALQNWDQIQYARERVSGRERYAVSMGREEDYTVYSVSNFARAARELAAPIIAPIMETREEAEIVRRNFQKSTVAVLRDHAALAPDTVLVHACHATAEDAALIAAGGASVVLCVRSAAEKRTGYPLLRHVGRAQLKICIGTDWANMNMLEEIRFLGNMYLLFPGMPSFSAEQLLCMATVNGARALGIAAETGSIERGKRADLVFLSAQGFHLPDLPEAPSTAQIASYVVHHMSAGHITDVMVDGKLQLAARELRTMPEETVLGTFRKLQEKFLPHELLTGTKHAGRPAEEQPPKTRIVPFVAPLETPELEGFEEGFSIVSRPEEEEPPPASPDPTPKSPLKIVRPAPPPDQPANKPELSRDVRRVFGDEDDPGLA